MILILGSKGQVGRSLKVSKPKKIEANFLDKQQCDITNLDMLTSYIKKLKPIYVINTAAYTNVSRAEAQKKLAENINSKSVKNLSILSNKYKFVLIHISTDYVFDGKIKRNYKEDHKPHPLSIYGKSKLLGENEIIKNSKKFIIIRTSGVFSHFQSSFLYKILIKGRDKKDLFVVSDQICYPTYSFDLADILWNIVSEKIKLKFNEVYHFTGHENPLSWFNFAKKAYRYAKRYNKLLPHVKPVNSMDYNEKVKRPINSCLSNQKINSFFKVNSNINKNIKESVDLFYKYNS